MKLLRLFITVTFTKHERRLFQSIRWLWWAILWTTIHARVLFACLFKFKSFNQFNPPERPQDLDIYSVVVLLHFFPPLSKNQNCFWLVNLFTWLHSIWTITTSDNIINKIKRLQNKFIRLALRLPKCICPKLLHDSAGLPYVKDRLLSCATKTLDTLAQNPRALAEESISSNRLNPELDRYPTPLSAVKSVDRCDLMG